MLKGTKCLYLSSKWLVLYIMVSNCFYRISCICGVKAELCCTLLVIPGYYMNISFNIRYKLMCGIENYYKFDHHPIYIHMEINLHRTELKPKSVLYCFVTVTAQHF